MIPIFYTIQFNSDSAPGMDILQNPGLSPGTNLMINLDHGYTVLFIKGRSSLYQRLFMRVSIKDFS